ncbi:MAG: ribosome small subunit-dependent GTPase A [Planctomycetota bacterium]
MAGRNTNSDKGGGRREQTPKQARGNARGHGSHHRHQEGRGAPRKVASGKDRTMDIVRHQGFSRLQDDDLADLSVMEKKADVENRIEESEHAAQFGATLDGIRARGTVVEVRKGNFLTRIDAPAMLDSASIPRIIRTIVRGALQHFDLGLSSLVAPGDIVEMAIPKPAGEQELFQTDTYGILLKVQGRRSEFRRLHPSGRAFQTLASNIDQVAIVASTAEPDFRPGFVDRVLVCAASSNLSAALILNKIDMGIIDSDHELLAVYRSLGHNVFLTSNLDPVLGAEGLAALKHWMAGKRTVLSGHSGVGKSSLMLGLDSSLNVATVRTGAVSTQTGKGTHTTTHARLFEVDFHDGTRAEIVDTPGVREFTPADTDRQNLWGWFPEIAALQGQCAYADCVHLKEKGCAVLAALERREIHPRRHHSYARIYDTLPN